MKKILTQCSKNTLMCWFLSCVFWVNAFAQTDAELLKKLNAIEKNQIQ